MVAAAVRAGARELEVESDSKRTRYRFDMIEPDLGGGHTLLDTGGSARWLVLAMAAQGLPTSLLCPTQGRKLSLGSQLCEVQPYSSTHPDRRLTVEVPTTRGAPSVVDVLRRHCSLCPVMLKLQGRQLQKDLTQAYRGSPLAWSEAVSPLFRPPQAGTLNTPLALFWARTRAPQPTWVAVVGGVSYPFLLPQAEGQAGVFWSDALSTDLSLGRVIEDEIWTQTLAEITRAIQS